jgi:hypothetical protein
MATHSDVADTKVPSNQMIQSDAARDDVSSSFGWMKVEAALALHSFK